MIGLTKAIAADFVAQGHPLQRDLPGTVDTPSLHDRINAFADPVQARKDFVARQPMGRLGTAEEIAGIVVFLASDESLFATGNVYSVDGGMTMMTGEHNETVRYGKPGNEKPGLIDAEGKLRDLSEGRRQHRPERRSRRAG